MNRTGHECEVMTPTASFHTKSLVVTTLPGPTRKRKPSPYLYRLTYRREWVPERNCWRDMLVGQQRV